MLQIDLFVPDIETAVFGSRCVNAACNTKTNWAQFALEARTPASMSFAVAVIVQNTPFYFTVNLLRFVSSLDAKPTQTDKM